MNMVSIPHNNADKQYLKDSPLNVMLSVKLFIIQLNEELYANNITYLSLICKLIMGCSFLLAK